MMTAFLFTLAFSVAVLLAGKMIAKEMKTMSEALDKLTAEVTETRAATTAAVALIGGLAQQIRDNLEDPEALEALADSLQSGQDEIAAAITANTPAAEVAEEELPADGAAAPTPATGGEEE